MGGRRAQRRASASKPQTAARRAYHSDSDARSDSDDARPAAGPIPLQSLEQHDVRDFAAEMAQRRPSNAHAGKRARAEREREQQREAEQRQQQRQKLAEKVVWRKFEGENRAFEQYYQRVLFAKGLEISGSQQQQQQDPAWLELVASLRRPVPVYLRVNGNAASLSEIVTGTLEMDFASVNELEVPSSSEEGDVQVALSAAPWAPHKRMWKLSVDSKTFRKAEALRPLARYVHTHVQLGTMQRMDPLAAALASFLEVQSGDRVLDLCGGGQHRAPSVVEAFAGKPGALVVNTPDAAAAAQAVQTLGRTLAVSRDVVVTMHKPLQFPTSMENSESGAFDHVICIAPSSGDGLIRASPEKWRNWTPAVAHKHHASQFALAAKAMQLVRVGGSLLYCTHSMNPIEDEAVVAQVLRASKGAYELVNVDHVCPQLARRQGLTEWPVVDADMNEVTMWETATATQRQHLRASMWPPTTAEQDDQLHLERCARFLPHLNDSNGLFVARIRKLRAFEPAVLGPAAPTVPHKMTASEKKQDRLASKKRLGGLTPIDDSGFTQLCSFFGISSHDLAGPQVLERSGFAQDRAVHIVSTQVSALLTTSYPGRLCIYRAGVDALKRVAATNTFELTDDGTRALLPMMHRRVASLPLADFQALLGSKELWLKHASAAVRDQLSELADGSFVVVLDDLEPLQTADRDLVLSAVKRPSSCSITSSPAMLARIKTLLQELDGADDEDGYESLEYDDE